MAVLAFSPAAAMGAGVEDPSSRVYAGLGDSYSSGAGDEEGRGGYVGRNFEYWRDAGLVDTLSQHGGFVLDSRGPLDDTLRDINQPSDTAIVTVNAGISKVGSPECTPVTSSSCPIEASLESIIVEIDQALAADPGDESRILMAYGPVRDAQPPYQRLLGADATIACVGPREEWGLNDLISSLAARNAWLLADTFPLVEPNKASYFSSDGIHPNAAGYAAMTEAFKAPATPATEPCPDVRAPELELSGRTQQRLGKAVRVKAECSEECTATASGKLIVPGVRGTAARGTSRLPLEPITQQLGAGGVAVLEIEIDRDARRAAARALDAGEAVQAKLNVKAVDAAANATVVKRRIDFLAR